MRAAIVMVVCMAACTPAIYEVPGVAELSAAEVAECRFVGKVRGIPGVFGPLKDIGLQDARRAAKEKAKEVGGDTVVFDPLPEGEEVFELPAQVYDCR